MMIVTDLILMVLGLILIFIGKEVIRFIAFLIGGIIGGLAAYVFTLPYLGSTAILAGVAGFLIIGILTHLLLPVGAGIASGIITYLFLKPILGGLLLPLIISVIVFIVVLILFNKILAVGSALFGAILFTIGISRFVSLNSYVNLLLIIFLTIVGSVIQLKK